MAKPFLLAALTLLLSASAALAQTPAYTVTVEIEDLPARGTSNGTELIVPFQVRASVAGASPCLSQQSSYTVTLDATVVNSTGNHTTAQVHPRQVTIAGPVLLPAVPGASAERTVPATLVVNAGPYASDALNATVLVTATFEGGSGGCPGASAAASSDEATLRADFEPVRGFGNALAPGNEMPGPGLLALLVALVVVGIVLRRRA